MLEPIIRQRCRICDIAQPITNFHKSPSNATGRDYRCKACRRTAARKWYSKQPENITPPSFKNCPVCKLHLPTAAFQIARHRRDGLYHHCKQCAKRKREERESAHPYIRQERLERLRQYIKSDSHRQRRKEQYQHIKLTDTARYQRIREANNAAYRRRQASGLRQALKVRGITLGEYEKMNEAQGGVCAICRQPQQHKFRQCLDIDHCHASGKVRGLLCSKCNVGIGLLREDAIILQNAASYLKQHAAPRLF